MTCAWIVASGPPAATLSATPMSGSRVEIRDARNPVRGRDAALDAAAYGGPGIDEVTPALTLRDDGVAALLRVRSATCVEQPVEEGR